MRCIRFLFSIPGMVVLLLVYGVALGCATFIEAWYGAETARAVVYEAPWMTILYVLITLNLIGLLIRHRLWQRGKRPVLTFHAGFLLILFGAALTRYKGFEGTLHLREGEASDRLFSTRAYLTMRVEGRETLQKERPVRLSAITPNRIRLSARLEGIPLQVRLLRYWPFAVPKPVSDPQGIPIVALLVQSGDETLPLLLRTGEAEAAFGKTFVFEPSPSDSTIGVKILRWKDRLFLTAPMNLGAYVMREGSRLEIPAGTEAPLEPGILYTAESLRFTLRTYEPHGRIDAEPVDAASGEGRPAIRVEASVGQERREVVLFGGPGEPSTAEYFTLGGFLWSLGYGSTTQRLPFKLRLEDFIITRYPGSPMPSGYESRIMVEDPEKGRFFPYRIYMNHILRYRGYRFFQTSYDADERGSLLTVSHDPGTFPTYLGYAVVSLALLMNFFHPQSRFRTLARALKGASGPAWLVACGLACLPTGLNGATALAGSPVFDIRSIAKDHARAFGRLIVQDGRGRMKPVQTLAYEGMRRLGHPERRLKVLPEQALLAIYVHPEGAATALSSTAQKESSGLFNGRDFRFYPLPGTPDGRWHAAVEEAVSRDTVIQRLDRAYREAVLSATATGAWQEADRRLRQIDAYQRRVGSDLWPSSLQTGAELLYNRLALFERLGFWLPLCAFLMLLLYGIGLFSGNPLFKIPLRVLSLLLVGAFLLQTFGLGLRWVASGHAPWANKYESMIYIAWATAFAGVLWGRTCRLTLATGLLLSGLILALAKSPAFDPRLTLLPPVLKSHWLILHVSMAAASYGFFGLGAGLGVLLICLWALGPARWKEPIHGLSKQALPVLEQSLLVGLTLITLGNFLGAVWANESWGRYWGWDPKETWTLIVILTYAVVLHLRLHPRWSGPLTLTAASVFAFYTVLMTYFGVNLYLTGLHSYAGGERPPIPVAPFVAAAMLLVLIGIARWRRST